MSAAEPQPPNFRSPTLRELISRLPADTPHHILDLGRVTSANVEFFSRFSCRLQIVDLLGAVTAEPSQALLASDPAAAFRKSLPAAGGGYDVVLAWDSLNYFSKAQLRALAGVLGALSAPDALMLALVYTGKEMPAASRTFRIVDEKTLLWEQLSDAVRPSPRYPPAEVERLLVPFAVVHSVLMRHGVQEFLFVRRGGE